MLTNLSKSLPYRNYIILLFLFNLLLISLVFLFKSNLPPVVPIYYGLPRGQEQLGPVSALSLPSLVSIIIVLLNTSFILLLKDQFLQKVLFGIMILATVLSSVTFVKIFLIVGGI